MDSTLRYIHNDSDLSTNSSFSPDEERRSKVQVSDKKVLYFVWVLLIPLLNTFLTIFGPAYN